MDSITATTSTSAPAGSAWHGVELRHLFALRAVAETGSFSRAAERLSYTQSAISQQIATLERMVGLALFDRPGGPRPVQLTEAGTSLLRHADVVVARLETAAADLRALATGEQGTLRVGVVQSVGTRVLPALLRRFHHDWPGIAVSLTETSDYFALLALVERGDLDLAFAALPLPDGSFDAVEVLDDPYVFVVPGSSSIAAATATTVTIETIATTSLIGFRNDACQRQVLDCFAHLGHQPPFVFLSDDNSTIQGCVAAGVACWLTPLLTVDQSDRDVRILRIVPSPPSRRIGLAWHANRRRPAAAVAFTDAAVEVCGTLVEGATERAAVTSSP